MLSDVESELFPTFKIDEELSFAGIPEIVES